MTERAAEKIADKLERLYDKLDKLNHGEDYDEALDLIRRAIREIWS